MGNREGGEGEGGLCLDCMGFNKSMEGREGWGWREGGEGGVRGMGMEGRNGGIGWREVGEEREDGEREDGEREDGEREDGEREDGEREDGEREDGEGGWGEGWGEGG